MAMNRCIFVTRWTEQFALMMRNASLMNLFGKGITITSPPGTILENGWEEVSC